jgi:hypothetical protein
MRSVLRNLASDYAFPGGSFSQLVLQLTGTNLVSPGSTGAHAAFVPDLSALVFAQHEFMTYTIANERYDGYIASFRIDSATIRPTTVSVPEPGVLVLLSGGLIAVGLARRRRAGSEGERPWPTWKRVA